MPNTKNEDKRAKIDRVYRLLRQNPGGLKKAEIADSLHLERRTVQNYLTELESEGKVYREGWYWYPYASQPIVLRKLELHAEEAMTLYLASRLFVKQSDKRSITAENALSKLAEMLQTDAGLDAEIAEAAEQLASRPKQDGYEDVFRTVMRGYLHRRAVQIHYHPYKNDSFKTTIHPYLLEPSGIGFSTYVIGHSTIVNDLRTYKIERIASARLLNEEYAVPDDFSGLDLLKNAWSIYYGDDLVDVTLRFSPEVARRVRETNWHQSQQEIVDDPDNPGYVLVRFQVADTTDLKPWIRTWGANCEVREPSDLRAEMIGEARRLAELYGVSGTTNRDRYEDIF